MAYFCAPYLALCVDIALSNLETMVFSAQVMSYRPLGSVSFDHVGVQRMTVDAH